MASIATEFVNSSSSQESQESVNSVSSSPKQSATANTTALVDNIYVSSDLDQRIKPEDRAIVHTYLAEHSVKWYEIGLYLRIPKEKLDEIEVDHQLRVSRRLIEMIDEWMKNSVNCTWRALVEAVQDCDQTNTYHTVSIQDSKIVIKPKTSKQTSSGDDWEEKEKSLIELQATFQMLLSLQDNARAACVVNLRGYFKIPDDVSDQMMLTKVEQYIPVELTVGLRDDFILILDPYKNIIFRYVENLECLEVWANILITNTKEAHDKITNHIAMGGSSTNRETQKVDVNSATAYQRLLNQNLNHCLKTTNKCIKQTEHILTLSHSFQKFLSGAIPIEFIPVFTWILLCPHIVTFLTLPSIAATVFLICVIAAIIKLLCDIHPNLLKFEHFLQKLVVTLYTSAVRHMAKTYAIMGVIFRASTCIYIQFMAIPKLQQQPQFYDRPIPVHMVNMFQHWLIQDLAVNFSFIYLVVAVMLALLGYISKRHGVQAFCCLMVLHYFWTPLVTRYPWLIVAIVILVLILSLTGFLILVYYFTAVFFFTIFCVTGMYTMIYLGSKIYPHPMMDLTLILLIGPIEWLCLLALFRWTKIPLKLLPNPTFKCMQQLQESLDKLQSIRDSIQTLLHQDSLQERIQ